MDNFRSKSCSDGKNMQLESYYGGGGGKAGPTNMNDLRSYSTSHASSYAQPPPNQIQLGNELKIKKGKKSIGVNGSTSKTWGLNLNDPELQRKKRVASYKAYALEGKMKGSFTKSFRWIKDTCTHVVYGWW
ncbi:ABC family ABC transporter, putative [Actinidia rufa]|uniref:ABC family ABC transporter, putative n=1 Tax=Actinidia rufa TaxID=165716 RepID=A0A7J0GLT4_9ERIC|nr:ABC family ABC transporter, putative [Actinidia rufa]